MRRIDTIFGIGKKKTATEVSNKDDSLTQALIERARLKKQWWNPKNVKIEGYTDPWKD